MLIKPQVVLLPLYNLPVVDCSNGRDEELSSISCKQHLLGTGNKDINGGQHPLPVLLLSNVFLHFLIVKSHFYRDLDVA